jgi:hypothetical protein
MTTHTLSALMLGPSEDDTGVMRFVDELSQHPIVHFDDKRELMSAD